ncbi:hypothetical protein JCM10212_006356 [Sporobolomyces blumeae]
MAGRDVASLDIRAFCYGKLRDLCAPLVEMDIVGSKDGEWLKALLEDWCYSPLGSPVRWIFADWDDVQRGRLTFLLRPESRSALQDSGLSQPTPVVFKVSLKKSYQLLRHVQESAQDISRLTVSVVRADQTLKCYLPALVLLNLILSLVSLDVRGERIVNYRISAPEQPQTLADVMMVTRYGIDLAYGLQPIVTSVSMSSPLVIGSSPEYSRYAVKEGVLNDAIGIANSIVRQDEEFAIGRLLRGLQPFLGGSDDKIALRSIHVGLRVVEGLLSGDLEPVVPATPTPPGRRTSRRRDSYVPTARPTAVASASDASPPDATATYPAHTRARSAQVPIRPALYRVVDLSPDGPEVPPGYARKADLSSPPALSTATAATDLPALGFYNPTGNGGGWRTTWEYVEWQPLGEPINLVVSGHSSPEVLEYDGVIDYFASLRFSAQCFQFYDDGSIQGADLGDGNGVLNQTTILRYNYDDPTLGTCGETLQGGNHFRLWQQNGSLANSGAWFLAASKEHNILLNHMIVPNGYDRGRDEIVQLATTDSLSSVSSSSSASNATTTSPLSPHRVYRTTVRSVSGEEYFGVNPDPKTFNHYIGTDGRIAVLTVEVVGQESDSTVNAYVPSFH